LNVYISYLLPASNQHEPKLAQTRGRQHDGEHKKGRARNLGALQYCHNDTIKRLNGELICPLDSELCSRHLTNDCSSWPVRSCARWSARWASLSYRPRRSLRAPAAAAATKGATCLHQPSTGHPVLSDRRSLARMPWGLWPYYTLPIWLFVVVGFARAACNSANDPRICMSSVLSCCCFRDDTSTRTTHPCHVTRVGRQTGRRYVINRRWRCSACLYPLYWRWSAVTLRYWRHPADKVSDPRLVCL